MKSFVAFLRRRENLPILIIPLLLLIWGRFGAPTLGQASFTNVALFDSPYRAALPVAVILPLLALLVAGISNGILPERS